MNNSDDQAWTAASLLDADFPEQIWKVEGLVPDEGLMLIAGKRKIGKGWLYLQLADACDKGGLFLERQAQRCRTLIYALEDNPRRLKRRLLKQGVLPTENIAIRFRWPGWDVVATEIVEGKFDICIVDTVSRAMPEIEPKDTTKWTEALSQWQEFALANKVLVVGIDHERKSKLGQSHSMDEVLGSQAKTAVADAIMQLHREQGKHDTVLSADGRDYEDEVELVVKFDRKSACWQVVGRVEEVKRGVSKEVLDAIATIRLEDAETLPTTQKIAMLIGMTPGYVSQTLADLEAEGEVAKGPKIGREQPYFLPGTDVSKWYESLNDQDG